MNTQQFTINIRKTRETREFLASFGTEPMKHFVLCKAVIDSVAGVRPHKTHCRLCVF